MHNQASVNVQQQWDCTSLREVICSTLSVLSMPVLPSQSNDLAARRIRGGQLLSVDTCQTADRSHRDTIPCSKRSKPHLGCSGVQLVPGGPDLLGLGRRGIGRHLQLDALRIAAAPGLRLRYQLLLGRPARRLGLLARPLGALDLLLRQGEYLCARSCRLVIMW